MANPERQSIPNLFAEEDAKRVVTPNRSWDNTLGFLVELNYPIDALNVQSADDPKNWLPPVRNFHRDCVEQYERQFERFSRYAGFDGTMAGVGAEFGVTKERVRQIVDETLKSLYEHAPLAVKEKYLPKSLATRKNKTTEQKMRLSLARGGKSVKVAEALAEHQSVKQISEQFGGLAGSRTILKGWGLDLPYVQEPTVEKFSGLGDGDLKPRGTQSLLNQVDSHGQYRTLLKAGLVFNLTSTARRAGLFACGRDIARICEALDVNGVPRARVIHSRNQKVGKKVNVAWYHYIAAKDEARAIAALESFACLEDLRTNPVTVIGNSGRHEIPTTTQLRNHERYEHIGNLIKEMIGRQFQNNNGVTIPDFLEETTARAYSCTSGYYFAKEDRDELVSYLAPKLAELGLRKDSARS